MCSPGERRCAATSCPWRALRCSRAVTMPVTLPAATTARKVSISQRLRLLPRLKSGVQEQHAERGRADRGVHDAPSAITAEPAPAEALADRQERDDRRQSDQREAGHLLPGAVDPKRDRGRSRARRSSNTARPGAGRPPARCKPPATTQRRSCALPNTGSCFGAAAEQLDARAAGKCRRPCSRRCRASAVRSSPAPD